MSNADNGFPNTRNIEDCSVLNLHLRISPTTQLEPSPICHYVFKFKFIMRPNRKLYIYTTHLETTEQGKLPPYKTVKACYT